ncbi:phage baseplate plug family protein [Methylobacterium sp. NPDC080182]|uniref:phage baseplate plug family protein n=1 Tax=Methylobacterium sp. NPDC080182 TaxID=3390590 RepID=UPI003CFEC666
MQIIPLQAVPNQSVKAQLGNQPCKIIVQQKLYGLFADLYVNEALLVGGVICQDRNRLVRSAYLGFSGDLMFTDTMGTEDPTSDGLGSRFQLVYLDPSELVD